MNDETSLLEKVGGWLNEQGYPLEYFAAHQFRKAGFSVDQGRYVGVRGQKVREVDVAASMRIIDPDFRYIFRVYNVIECKWTKSHPWVCLRSESGQMLSSALMAQAVASQVGEAALWVNVGKTELAGLSIFTCPAQPSFSGRQALTKKGASQDVFYDAVRSVVANAKALASEYDVYLEDRQRALVGNVVLPVIVIDGMLFEAFAEKGSESLTVEQVNHSRLMWRGEADRVGRIAVDIVTKEGLPDFVRQRAEESKGLIEGLKPTLEEILLARKSGSLKGITVKSAPTGMIGRPRLFAKIESDAANDLAGNE